MTALRQDDILSAVWRACDTFRGAVDATQYKDYVLTALFLKYISDVRRKHVEEFRREYRGDEVRIQRRLDRERFKVPTVELKNAKTNTVEESFLGDFYSLYERRGRDNIGELINIVLDAIEKANEGKLGGLFRAIDFNSETNLGQTKDRNRQAQDAVGGFREAGARSGRHLGGYPGRCLHLPDRALCFRCREEGGGVLHAAQGLRSRRQARSSEVG